ncbi:hypothetical protein Tco_0721756 [Tanacetum coccineum]
MVGLRLLIRSDLEEKAIEESNRDAVAEVTVDKHLQQIEEVVLKVETSKESKIIENNIDEEASCIQDSTEDTLDPTRTSEKPTKVCEFTSEDIATNTEKIEDEIKEKDAIFQAPNLSSESGEGKQNSIMDMLNKAGEVVQPQEHISNTKSDVEIKEEVELTHSGLQQTSVEKNPEGEKFRCRSADIEVPSAMDAKDDKMNLGSTCDKGKSTEEVSGIKQEPLEFDVHVYTVATEDLDISHKGVTDVVMKTSQIKTEMPKNEVSAKAPQNESIESKMSAQNVYASHAQGEPNAKLLFQSKKI